MESRFTLKQAEEETPKSFLQSFIQSCIQFCAAHKESLRIAGLLLLTIAIIASAILTAGGALAIWGAAGAAAYGISAATASIFFTTGVTGLTIFAGIPIGVGVSYLLNKASKGIAQWFKNNFGSGSGEKEPLLVEENSKSLEQGRSRSASFSEAEATKALQNSEPASLKPAPTESTPFIQPTQSGGQGNLSNAPHSVLLPPEPVQNAPKSTAPASAVDSAPKFK